MNFESTRGKNIYFLYVALSLVVVGFGWIGANPQTQNIINFYTLYLFVPSLFLLVIDFFTKGKEMEEIDTVTWEEPHIGFLNNKMMIISGLIISAVIGWQIVSQGVGLVSAPQFNIFDSPIGNAVLSGIIGIYENLIFFGILYPTIRKIISKHMDTMILGVIIASIITSGVFMGYHWWRYGMNEVALYSVLFFAVINVAFIQVSNSLVWSDMIHFLNNFLIVAGYASQVVVMLIL